MRLALLADVHGNLPALEAVLDEVRQAGVDGLLVAGDMVDGPQPVEALHRLCNAGAWLIRGNRENYFLALDRGDVPPSWQTGDQWASLRWVHRQLGREEMAIIAALPEQRTVALDGTAPIRVVHGAPQGVSALLRPSRDPAALEPFAQAGLLGFGYVEVDLEDALAHIAEPVLVCGHCHLPWLQEHGRRLALNPGSVGATLCGDPRARYALLTWAGGHWQAELRAVSYDASALWATARENGFVREGGAFALGTLLAAETGQNVLGRLVTHISRFAARAGMHDWNAIPDAIWHQAADCFDWQAAAGGPADPERRARLEAALNIPPRGA